MRTILKSTIVVGEKAVNDNNDHADNRNHHDNDNNYDNNNTHNNEFNKFFSSIGKVCTSILTFLMISDLLFTSE